jgi:hypothetical protein
VPVINGTAPLRIPPDGIAANGTAPAATASTGDEA